MRNKLLDYIIAVLYILTAVVSIIVVTFVLVLALIVSALTAVIKGDRENITDRLKMKFKYDINRWLGEDEL